MILKIAKYIPYVIEEEAFTPSRGLTSPVATTCPTHDCITLLPCLNCTRTTDYREQLIVSAIVILFFVFILFPLKRQ